MGPPIRSQVSRAGAASPARPRAGRGVARVPGISLHAGRQAAGPHDPAPDRAPVAQALPAQAAWYGAASPVRPRAGPGAAQRLQALLAHLRPGQAASQAAQPSLAPRIPLRAGQKAAPPSVSAVLPRAAPPATASPGPLAAARQSLPPARPPVAGVPPLQVALLRPGGLKPPPPPSAARQAVRLRGPMLACVPVRGASSSGGPRGECRQAGPPAAGSQPPSPPRSAPPLAWPRPLPPAWAAPPPAASGRPLAPTWSGWVSRPAAQPPEGLACPWPLLLPWRTDGRRAAGLGAAPGGALAVRPEASEDRLQVWVTPAGSAGPQ
jgi:hypothetical protein